MASTLPLNSDPSKHYLSYFPGYVWGETILGTGFTDWVRLREDGYCITWFDAERQKREVDNTTPDYKLIESLRRDTPKYHQEFKNKDWGEYDLVVLQDDLRLVRQFPDAVFRPHPRLTKELPPGLKVDTTSNPIELVKNAKSVHSMDSSLLVDAMLWGTSSYAYRDSMFHGMSQPDKWLTWYHTKICVKV